MSIETFSCAFSDGSSVTVSFDVEAIQKTGQSATSLKLEWENHPSKKVIPEYIAWMHTIQSDLAKRINKRILYTYPPSQTAGAVYFLYEPDGSFKQVPPPS